MMMKKTNIVLALALLVAACHTQQRERDELVDFLYQYMPLPDSTDYSRQFYEQQVALSLSARSAMPWGNSVPQREFRHFVVPVRVNNETLDTARSVFYHELKPRVETLSMKEAILEVNHWCHERVSYRPTDARTSSPLATVCTAYGRCGEESTLLVAALRAVCIPARQVYTPRWAHTDDNHAWVEAWADGEWHFLGACEPEPVLDLGWFNESASRGMLMHTKAFGHYDGPEEVMSRTPCYTEINVTDHYAPTATVVVAVVDADGRPVADASVHFKLYNYAEFYTVAMKTTDAKGRASLSAGHGDMLVWVVKDGMSAMQKVTFDRDKELQLQLGADALSLPVVDLDMVPPVVGASLPPVADEQRRANNRRLAYEDSLRQAYEQTMPVEAWRGNHVVVQQFIDHAVDKSLAQRLLNVLSAKDLHDVSSDVLADHSQHLAPTAPACEVPDQAFYDRYVLCPRVENEWLTPYRSALQSLLLGIVAPEQLERWCADSITLREDRNPQQLRMQPLGVARHRVADRLGRSIFFVSAARSLGFAARINEVDGRTQYYYMGQWHDAQFDASSASEPSSTLTLKLNYREAAQCPDPKYYVHFTLSRIVDGVPQLLTYPEEATWQRYFKDGIQVEPGHYLLTTGTRMASGKVLARMQHFVLNGDTTVTFTLREDREEVQVIGAFNAENIYHDLATDADKSVLSTTGRGYFVLGIVAPGHEPSVHALNDMAACRGPLEQWGRKVVVLFTDADAAGRFNFGAFGALPANVVWGIDPEGKILREIKEELRLKSTSLPLFIIADTFGHVVFVQQGYTIHLGEQLLKVVHQL